MAVHPSQDEPHPKLGCISALTQGLTCAFLSIKNCAGGGWVGGLQRVGGYILVHHEKDVGLGVKIPRFQPQLGLQTTTQ